MLLTEKHINYETDCRRIFVNQIIRGVIYGEVKYCAFEEEDTTPTPYYKTKYPEIDTVDHSIYFKTDSKTIHIFWDNTFFCYGLLSAQLDFTETTNDFEQKWDVSDEFNWTELKGQKIIDFKIIWEEVWTSNLDGSNKIYTTYPQTFMIFLENGKTIIISASEFKHDTEDEAFPISDNLLVTTNINLAKQLKIIE